MAQDIDFSHLNPAECILLAERVWEQARTHAEALPLTHAQRDELNRRLAALDAGTMEAGDPGQSCGIRTYVSHLQPVRCALHLLF